MQICIFFLLKLSTILFRSYYSTRKYWPSLFALKFHSKFMLITGLYRPCHMIEQKLYLIHNVYEDKVEFGAAVVSTVASEQCNVCTHASNVVLCCFYAADVHFSVILCCTTCSSMVLEECLISLCTISPQ